MKLSTKIWRVILVLDLLIINGFIGYFIFKSKLGISGNKNVNDELNNADLINKSDTVDVDTCGENCKNYIDSVISYATRAANISAAPTSSVKTTLTKTKIKNVSYVPIPGSGSVLATDWTDISGSEFYFTKIDYPGITEVYFEVNMKLLNGNGMGFVRLYDATHSVGVAGSEVQTSSQKSVFVGSGKINLYDGYNLYKVQAKSLTADTTVFESGRLKVITEN